MPLTGDEAAVVADRIRVLEVRRLCQVAPSIAQYARDANSVPFPKASPGDCSTKTETNGALAALLRCLVHELGADIAMLSLLDDHTQYFISGCRRDHVHRAEAKLEDTNWYGCDSVSHHGGLCERTVSANYLLEKKGLYEELDMKNHESFKHQPFVNGTVGEFRHYAGVPVTTESGLNIGTVFIMKQEPSAHGISPEHRDYMVDTATSVMQQLNQAVEALDNRRALKYSEALTSLLGPRAIEDIPSRHSHISRQHDDPRIAEQYSSKVLDLYYHSSKLLCHAFDFDGVAILEATSMHHHTSSMHEDGAATVLAQHLQPQSILPCALSAKIVAKLLDAYPQGAIFHARPDCDDDVMVTTAVQSLGPASNSSLTSHLAQAFRGAQQIMLMPLWDSFHERNVAIAICFASDLSRIYSGIGDLPALSAFSMATMTQLRRVEALAMDKVKSDFLGSISHETRSPLHGVLASLDLMLDTPCNEQQLDLLSTAKFSSQVLLETIDKILSYSRISSTRHSSVVNSKTAWSFGQQPQVRERMPINSDANINDTDGVELIRVCEDVVESVTRKLRSSDAMTTPRWHRPRDKPHHSPREQPGSTDHLVITLDASGSDPLLLSDHESLRTIFENLISNASRYNYRDGYIRISIETGVNDVKFMFADSGRGMSPDYLRNSLWVPFSQTDPIDAGTGLGLVLVQHTVAALDGTIDIQSDETIGTTVCVTIPRSRLEISSGQMGESRASEGATGSNATDSTPPKAHQHATMRARFVTPDRWSVENDRRHRRCVDDFSASLSNDLCSLVQTELLPWSDLEDMPDLILVLQEDLQRLVETNTEKFTKVKKIVICPHSDVFIEPDVPNDGYSSILYGPVTPSKLRTALALLFPNDVSAPSMIEEIDLVNGVNAKLHIKTNDSPSTANGVDASSESSEPSEPSSRSEPSAAGRGGREGREPPSALPSAADGVVSNDPKPTNGEVDISERPEIAIKESGNGTTPHVRSSHANEEVEPKLLLCDDNGVNLKVLTMYAKKCSKVPAISAPGGQEAIDAYEDSLRDGEQRIDVLFLDLSMPEVSGFDVAVAIRKREEEAGIQPPMYIAALTSLVSAKDRNAAFAAGVDDYVTKPAKLKDLQAVIEKWRSKPTG